MVQTVATADRRADNSFKQATGQDDQWSYRYHGPSRPGHALAATPLGVTVALVSLLLSQYEHWSVVQNDGSCYGILTLVRHTC